MPRQAALKVCVSSSFPERLNRNLSIAASLAEGFSTLLGAENVKAASYSTLVETVSRFRPDLLVLVGSCLAASSNYEDLARAVREVGATFAFWSVEDPYEIDARARFTKYADVVFTNEASAQPFYEHPRVHHLRTAASPTRHLRTLAPQPARSLDVFFCGVGYRNRQRLIRDAEAVLSRHRTLVVGDNWPSAPFVRNERMPVDQLCDVYADARIVLNIGRDFNLANDQFNLSAVTPGPRTYEAALAGCVQLYHVGSRGIEADFVIDEEILTFETVAELGDRISWVLAHPELAHEMAAKAQLRALADHTYAKRAMTILGTIDALPQRSVAPPERYEGGTQV